MKATSPLAWWQKATLYHAQRISPEGDDAELAQTDHDALLTARWGLSPPGPYESWRGFYGRCGPPHFRSIEILAGSPIPARWAWSRLLCLAMLLEELRPHTGPLTVRSVWRPPMRNRDLGGATWSDHIFACAVDFDCVDTAARDRAWPAVLELYLQTELALSLGLRSRGYHIGALSPRGHRRWMYEHREVNGRMQALACAWDDSREPRA